MLTQDEESSGYDSFEGVGAGVITSSSSHHLSLYNPCYNGPESVDTHNSYASVLKCPTDGRDAKKFEGVEMREKSCNKVDKRRPRSEILISSMVTGARARPVSDSEITSVKENLVMYVMGGREVGQINMFQRNISVWKLQL